jgi:hypothetical protein
LSKCDAFLILNLSQYSILIVVFQKQIEVDEFSLNEEDDQNTAASLFSVIFDANGQVLVLIYYFC